MKKQNLINDSILWSRIKDYATRVGRISTRPVVLLYYVLKSPKTPKSDKFLIYSAIVYLVFSIDIISTQRLPIIGWLDEMAALSVAFKRTRKHITPEMEHNVDVLLDKWFPIYSSYEIVSY